VIGASTTKADLDGMAEGGIRGIRVNLETGGTKDPAVAKRTLDAAAKQIEGRSWHMHIYAGLPMLSALRSGLGSLAMPAVFDHFAGAEPPRASSSRASTRRSSLSRPARRT
jgi:hypothetical protein